jgi:hypothetical protein
MIIEDTVSRNKAHKERFQKKIEDFTKHGAPESLLERFKMIANMTYQEYEIFLEEEEKFMTNIDKEYAESNPIQESIVTEIYNRGSKLGYKGICCTSAVCWNDAIDPLDFMIKDDFEHNLYQTFLDHAQEIYNEKYSEQYERDSG